MRPVEKIASCEISFIPIQSDDYIQDVNKVLDIIRLHQLEYSVGILSTTVRGESSKIISLIKDIYEKMDEVCHFTMDIRISNICGCK
ncbi:MAG: YkoF family thiamine/hydroxymethylpyrimidine-binding protein [Bacillota bacterium]|jgi:uncharacterized protein YqgV (UPF0045/DUF77 family)|nr:hypothetical protein [Clostridia bacterium]